MKGRNGADIEEVPRIEDFVPVEDVGAAMDLISARPGDSVDHCAGGSAELGCVSRRDDVELLNGVHAKIRADDIARRAIRVVVFVDAINAIGVLVRAMAVACQLIAESAHASIGVTGGGLLRAHTDDAGLQSCELGPVSAVQGQINDPLLSNGCAHDGGISFDVGRRCGNLDP